MLHNIYLIHYTAVGEVLQVNYVYMSMLLPV